MVSGKIKMCIGILLLFVEGQSFSQTANKNEWLTPLSYVQYRSAPNAFCIATNGKTASICVDSEDWKGVVRAANDLGDDVGKVSGTASEVFQKTSFGKSSIIIGTIGKSHLIDQLIANKKIDVTKVKGKWESFLIQTVDGNLVIAGSDKRGTIFGIYDVSEKIGVSPWYWWADAPIKKNNSLYVKAGKYIQESPKVKYRGIFINDESPSFTGWCRAKFGGVNSKMYAHMFELLLRLKANYLWPAMWGNAFNEDDPLNPVLGDEYGIVMGTSHHEPMMRAQKEYTPRSKEVGPWDFVKNPEGLKKFWEEGLRRNKNFDNLITMGMRGDGDVAMGEGDDKENIKTLQDVVKSQRDIIQKVYNDAPSNHPQLWAIFTEVQRYYDAGLTVPDDITLLFCDNNWGYIRRTEPPKEKNRKGGSGLYYHIDMNGGPWNDRWINTTTIPKLHQQLNLAYQSGLDKIWIINVGDLKPKELPIDFIMRFAWNPDAIPANRTFDYTVNWAEKIFGSKYAREIASIVSRYAKYNLWRKPETQVPGIFSIVNHHEADSIVKLWQKVVEDAETLEHKIAPEARDAYYQLVLYPAKASAGVAEMYIDADINNLYARQGRVSANDYAKRARYLYAVDSLLSKYYNDTLAAGKWKNMMSDVHIGYRQWSMPRSNTMPAVVDLTPLAQPTMGIAIEGSELAWPTATSKAVLPTFDRLKKSTYYIDVFNKGTGSFQFQLKANKPWIQLSKVRGVVKKEQRIQVSIKWELLKEGEAEGMIEINAGDSLVQVFVNAIKAAFPATSQPFFGSLTGEFSIPATNFNANKPGKNAVWIMLPDLGRSAGDMGISPVTAPSATLQTAPFLEYKVLLTQKDSAVVLLGILPTQDVLPQRGLRIGVALDNEEPQILDARKGLVDTFNEYVQKNLTDSKVLKPLPPLNRKIQLIGNGKLRRNEVFDNIRWLDVQLHVNAPGMHTLKVFMIDPEVVLEKIVLNPDNQHPSYFGAPAFQYKKLR
jgi:hypothetical protein